MNVPLIEENELVKNNNASPTIFNLRKISLVFAWRSYHRMILRPPFIMLAMKKLCRYNIVRKTFMGKCLKCVVEGNFMILIPYSNTTCIFIPFLLLCKEDITPQLKSTGCCTSTQEVKRVEQSLSLLLDQNPRLWGAERFVDSGCSFLASKSLF